MTLASRRPPVATPLHAAVLIPIVALVLGAAIAARWSDGGHLSLDSIQQLVEAAIGRSTSWAPPFMSALLGVLGEAMPFDPVQAAEGFVLLCIGLGAAGFLLAAVPAVPPRWVWPRALLAAALVLNPVLLAYAGIVWKDTLFAALSMAAFGAALRGLASAGVVPRLAWSAAAVALAALLPEVRQHGMFVLPFVVAMAVLAVAWIDGFGRGTRGLLAVLMVLSAAGVNTLAGQWASRQVVEDEQPSTATGLRLVALFDLFGIERRIDVGPLRQDGLSPAGDADLQVAYTADRIDFFRATPSLTAYADSRTTPQVLGLWWRAVLAHPASYLDHRRDAFARLLGVGGACLPVHVGVSGLPHQVEALGLVEAVDDDDARTFRQLRPWFETPVFFHGSYLGLLALCTLALVVLPRRTRLSLAMPALAAAAYTGSFVVTGIACDFRYLLPLVALSSLLAVALLMGWRASSDIDGAGR
jgi:hypothetical protein